jgi:phosphoglycerol transferase MdoB-like AlkP superfamily enzyme
MTSPDGNRTARRWLAFGAALLLLNASLSFENLWPTPAIWWRGRLSIELAMSLLVLALACRAVNRSPAKWLRWLAVIWLILVFGRYGEVTAPALYGRDINLYWDARFMPDVAAMVVRVVPWWQIVLVLTLVLAGLFGLYSLIRWSFSQVTARLAAPGGRLIVGLTGTLMVIWFVVQRMELPYTEYPWFTRSVAATYARQARLALVGLTTTARLAPSPPMNADLSLVAGADVLLVFAESYGAITFDQPEFAGQLAGRRLALERAVADTNREIVSTFVESTTFGGSSWLAHISLLSGVEVRDHDSNALLMSEKRETMAAVFKRHGYRTIAFMPGLQSPWPEGSFYGFDQTYNAERLQYPGPDFGWFAVPDQFSLAWLDATEISPAPRPPLFVFFPTLSTHFPFSPTPPYQEDWPRILSEHKFSSAQIVDAYGEQLDWENFGPSYIKAVAYMYETIAGYLKLRPDRDFVMILVGDHQPPAAVSGEGASWDVPMHVITSRQPVLDRLKALGFLPGLEPRRRSALGRMDELLPVLLNGFSRHE